MGENIKQEIEVAGNEDESEVRKKHVGNETEYLPATVRHLELGRVEVAGEGFGEEAQGEALWQGTLVRSTRP